MNIATVVRTAVTGLALTHLTFLPWSGNNDVLAASRFQSGDPLTNSAAADFVGQYFNEHMGPTSLLLGHVSFVAAQSSNDHNDHQQTVALSLLPLYRACADLGLIIFSEETDRVAMIAASPRRSEGTVKRYPRTAQLASQFGPQLEYLSVPSRTYKITDIVFNDSYLGGTTNYRVVMGSFNLDTRPEMAGVYQKAGLALKDTGRFKALLKHNPFERKWEMVVFETSDAAGTFPASPYSVDRRILELGLSRK